MTGVVPGSSTEYRINTLPNAAKALVKSSNKGDVANEYSKCTIPNDFSIIIFKNSLKCTKLLAAWWGEIRANASSDTNLLMVWS